MMIDKTPAKIGRLMKKSEKFMAEAGRKRAKQWLDGPLDDGFSEGVSPNR
jgi:hypothetical protein